MKKPNILILAQLPPPVHGASTINQYIVDSQIINKNFNLTILPLSFVKSVHDIGKVSFLKITYLLLVIIKLIKLLLFKKVDLIYFTLSPTGYAFYRDILLVTVFKIFRKKIVYHLHGKGIRNRVLISRRDKFLYRFVFKNTSVIVLSESLISDIDLVYTKKPFVLNNGIDLQVVEKAERNLKESVTFIFLSNLVISKGIKTFLDAIVITHKSGHRFKVKIVGNSVDYTIEQAKVFVLNNNLSNFVHILGPKYGNEKFKELSNSDIFVFPTENDCFPLSLLEAMQMQLPIISTRTGAISDIVVNDVNGIIVEEGNAKQVSDAMILYINNHKLIEEHGLNNLKKFREKYSLDRFEENFVSIIEKAICQ